MAPESASAQPAQRVVSGQTVSVPKPVDGEILAVLSSPGGALDLGFDPSTATASREDNSLVFDLDDGSRVEITDFFAVGDESLPDLRLPDGTEVASLDFFEGSDLDMSTAAGTTAPPSGGSDASGDPLSMTSGLDALGVQATWYWGSTSDTGEELEGLQRPSGSFGFSLSTDLGFGSVDNIYEDASPFQNQGDRSLHAGRVNMQIETGPGTSVAGVTFSGLPEGAILWLGDPAQGGVALKANGAGQYSLDEGDFARPGLYLTPPPNSDADFNINVSVDFARGAITQTVNGKLPVTVDAVADRPEDISATVDADELAGAAAISGAEQSREDGWIKDEASRDNDVSGDQVSYTARMTVTASFSDYGEHDAADQSELHYALVQKPGEGWTCDEALDVVKIYHDADGNALAPVWNEATKSFDYDLRPAGAVGEPVEFFRVPVENDVILANNGTVDVDVTLHSPDGYFDANQGDHNIDLVTGAMALESAPSDKELSMDNNIAVNFGDAKASLGIDVIDSSLNLKLGWFAEGGDQAGAKFTGKAGTDYDPSVYEGATNAGASAKIELSIDNSGAEARSEHISQATFTVDQDAGSLHINGQPIAAGSYEIAGSVYDVTIDGDSVTISISGNPVSSLDGLDLSFVPGPAFDSNDVPFTYTVTVDSAESGAQAVFSGSSHIVADAVADMPGALKIGTDYEDGHSAVAPGGTASVEGSVSFSDNDGSERHYVVVTMHGKGWNIEGVGGTDSLLSKNAINEYWNSLADNKLPEDVLLKILTPGGDQGANSNKQYLMFEAWMDDDGGWQVTAWAGQNGVMTDVTDALQKAGAVFNFDPASGDLSYSIQLTAPDAQQDSSTTLYTKGVTLEVAGDDEYDYRNNISGTPEAKATTVSVEALTGRLSMALEMVEDSMPDQWRDANNDGAKDVNYSPGAVLIGGEYYGEHVGVTFSGGSAKEYVQSISFDQPEGGSLFYIYTDGSGQQVAVEVKAGAAISYDPYSKTITLPPAEPDGEPLVVPFKAVNAQDDWFDHFTFKPEPNWSGETALNFDAVTSSTRTPSQTLDQAGTGQVVVDSVADLATASSSMESGDRGQGSDQSYGSDGDYVSEAKVNESGWSVQTSGNEQSVAVNFTVTATFDDMDGSESGHILVPLPTGFAVHPDMGGSIETIDGQNYLRLEVGKLDADNGDLTVDPLSGSGTFTVNVKLLVDSSVEQRVTDLPIRVVTVENEYLGDLSNNTATNIIHQNVTVDHFEGTLTVKAGWGYEDNNPDQFGGTAKGAQDAAFNGEARADASGVPLEIDFNAGGTGEQLQSITLSFDSGQLTDGTFFYPSGTTFSAADLQNGSLSLRYVPAADNQDGDIPIRYEALVSDGGGATFTVNGGVSVVLDAVADIGRVTGVDIEADHTAVTNGVYEQDMSVTLTVEARFTDIDGSESHYVLVEQPSGWLCEGADVIKVFYDGAGQVLQPNAIFDGEGNFSGYDYQNAPEGTVSSKDFFRVDVTDQDGGNGVYNVTLKPGENADLSGDMKLATGTMSVESDFDGAEYDYSNNHAFDLSGVGNLNLMDSYLTRSVSNTYEDHRPNQHTGSTGTDSGGWIQVNIGNADSGKFVNGDGGEYLDNDGTVVISFTFVPSEAGATPGSFSFSAGGKTVTYSMEANPEAFTGPDANNQYQLSIPASRLSNGSDSMSSFKVRYNADANDDSDLVNVRVAVPVESADTGFTTTLTTEPVNLIVDAVADRPVSINASTPVYDADDNNSDGYAKADWGSKVEIEVNSTFTDLDGSEHHYLVIEARPGWTCENADGVIDVGGKSYFFKEADTSGGNGQSSFTFELQAPTADSAGAADLASITADGNVNIAAGGLAIEGSIVTNEAGVSSIDYGDLKVGVNEVRLDNNVAINTNPVEVAFDVINGSIGYGNSVFEDGDRNKHGGNLKDATYGKVRGNIGISLDDKQGGDIIAEGKGETDTPNCITFTYKGAEGSLGSFSYVEDGVTHKVMPVKVEGTADQYRVDIPDGAIQEGGKSIAMKYNPEDASVKYESTDLTDVEYHLNVASTTSKAEGYISGELNEGKSHPGTIIVDAVADQAGLGGVAEHYAEGQDAAQSGQSVNVAINDVQFFDYTDGSEKHFLIVQNRSVDYQNEEGQTGTEGFGTLGRQTIVISGTGPDGPVTQTVVIGSSAKTSSITITDAAGNVTEYPLSAGGVSYAQLIGSVNNALAHGGDTFARIPVLNEFLQLTDNGTVSATVQITVPEGQEVDTTYNLRAGAFVQDGEGSGGAGITADNNRAYTLQEIQVDVKVVTSDFDIEMVSNRVYENGMPEAFQGGEQSGEVGGYAYTYDSKGVATGAEFKPLFNEDGTVNAENLPYAGAEMQISGLDGGETASVTMTMTLGDDAGGQSEVNAGNWGTFYDADGNALAVEAVYNPETGTITLSFEVAGTDAPQSIYFVPGENYSADDISIGWQATVIDDDSGASKNFVHDQPLSIVVDAVAQAAESTLEVGGLEQNADGNFYVKSSQNFSLEIKAEFEDNDGSETHYMLVEITADSSLNAGFVNALKAAGCDLASGQNRYYQFEGESDTPVAVYYRIPVEAMENLAQNNPAYADCVSHNEAGEVVSITVPMSMDGGSTAIRTGTMAVESDSSQMGSYYDQDGHRVNEDMNLSKINDVGVNINEAALIKLSQATGGMSLHSKTAYEGDNADAHTGDKQLDGGVALKPGLWLGENDHFVVRNAETGDYEATSTPVTVNWSPAEAGAMFKADGTAVEPGQALTAAEAAGLVFVPAAGSTSDADVTVTYTLAAVRDDLSGDIKSPTSYHQEVVIDAVAQRPADIGCETEGKVDYGQDMNVPFSFQVTFADVTDGSTTHYGLVEYKAGWQLQTGTDESGQPIYAPVVVAPDGNQYFRIDVDNSTLTEGEPTTLSGTLVAPGHLAGTQNVTLSGGTSASLEGNMGDFDIGAMSVDNAGGGKEATWHNNAAVNILDDGLKVDYDFEGGGGGNSFWVHAFENDTPLAHLPEDQGGKETMGGAVFSLKADEGAEVTLSISPAQGTLTVNGQPVAHDGEGNYSFEYDPNAQYAFVPAENYTDNDLSVRISVGGEYYGTMHVLIDAVAQHPTLGDVEYHIDEGCTAYKAGEQLSFTVKADFADNDGSEGHYVLVLKEAGWQGDYDMTYYDGQAYFKVPVEKGADSVTVTLTPPSSGGDLAGGLATHQLTYRAMAVEEKLSGSEFVSENNVAITEAGTIDITVSEVATRVNVSLDSNRITESDGQSTVNGNIKIDLGEFDQVNSVQVTVPQGKGELTLTYETPEGQVITLNVDDKGFIDLAANPEFKAALENNSDSRSQVDIKVSYRPEAYDSQDVNISVKVNASDMLSGDAETGLGGSQKLEIDGLAWRADDVASEVTDYGAGATAAQVGGSVNVSIAATFENTGGSEQHFLLIESKANWDYPDGLAKTYDAKGTEFLMIPVDKVISDFLADNGNNTGEAGGIGFSVSFDEHGQVRVSADFEVTLPEFQVRGDETYVLKTGGLSVNDPVIDDYNVIANDVAFNTEGTLKIEVGVVDSKDVRDVTATIDEAQGEGDAVAAAIPFVTDNASDSVVSVQISLPEDFVGEIKYLGQTVEPVDGVITLPPAGSEGPFDPSGVTFVAPDYWSGDLDLNFEAAVADKASGAVSAADAFKGSISITVDPVATEPVSVTVEGPVPGGEYTAFEANTAVSFEVSAVFPDWDGSENHFVMVEAKEGWSGEYDKVSGPDGNEYFKVPVGDADYSQVEGGGQVTVSVTLTTPDTASDERYDLNISALAVEKDNGDQAWSEAQATVTINVAEVQANAENVAASSGDTTENVSGAENANASQLLFSLDSPGETLESITLSLPASGGKVVDAEGKVIEANDRGEVELDGALAQSGGYFFVPAENVSGDLELNYTVTVSDNASGATESFAGEALIVKVGAVTNAPEAVSGLAEGPQDIAGHEALMNVSLSADFVDADGSEVHYFLVALPAGTHLAPDHNLGEALAADNPLLAHSGFADYEGEVYMIPATEAAGSALGNAGFELRVEAGYDATSAGGIRYEAGSYEKALYDPLDAEAEVNPEAFKTLAGEDIAIDSSSLTFNLDPTVGDSSATLGDFLRNADAGASGTLPFSDADGDTLAVSLDGALFTGQDGEARTPVTDFDGDKGILSVEGDFGVLQINVYTGEYTYNLFTDENGAPVTPAANQVVSENFQLNVAEIAHKGVTVDLDHVVKSGTITITLEGANSAPRAEALVENMGAVNEADLEPVSGRFVFSDDDSGDAERVLITDVRAGESGAADFNPDTGLFEIHGDFGKLVIDMQGNYTYTQYNESQTGTENFTVSFSDPFGGSGSSTLTVNTAAVNHGPVAQDAVQIGADLAAVENGFIKGVLDLAAMDVDDGDRPVVTSITIDGEPYAMPAGGLLEVEGAHGTLQITADGKYMYQFTGDEEGNNSWDSFTYTIKDSGGLESSADLHIGIGAPDQAELTLDQSVMDQLGHDGYFNLGALHDGGDGYSLFAYDGNDQIIGSEGSDTIHAGAGDDVIHAGGAEGTTTTVYGGSGDDLLFAGQGNDVFHGGSGDDTFVWNTDQNFGGQDLVADFSNSAFGGTDNDQLQISFSDLFGDADLTSTQVIGGMTGEGNTFSYSQNNASFSATFEGDNSILLTMQNSSGQSQSITVHSADAFYSPDSSADMDATAAQAILEQIIKDVSS